jgi:hypothetical protein
MLERKLKFIKKLEELTKENKLQWSFRATMYSFYEVCHTLIDNQDKIAIMRFGGARDLSLKIDKFNYYIDDNEVQDSLKRLLTIIEEMTIDKTDNAIDIMMGKL